MIQSMTAYASKTGASGTTSWTWEMRGVNARGLDIRTRMPDGFDAVEGAARKAIHTAFQRGSITLGLRIAQQDSPQAFTLDTTQLDAVLKALDTVQERAFEMGVTLAQPTAADVLAQRGVMVQGVQAANTPELAAKMQADIAGLIADFAAMRLAEGRALQSVIADHLTQIAGLIDQAEIAAIARRPQMQINLTTALLRVMQDATEIDAARVTQELAFLVIKADVTEEIDRLKGHVAAARDLIASAQPAGRKLDFLAQEFNREANTLCSKAGASALTTIGLDLKAAIEQMREQIQNVE